MWTAVLCALLVASATAEYGWKPNSSYLYEFRSRTLASLHQTSDHYTGVVFKGEVTVQPKTDSHLSIKITDPEYAKVESSLPEGIDTKISDQQLVYKPMPLSTKPFEVKLNKGVVTQVIISKDVPIWEVNIIRSIVSQFQLDTHGERVIPSKLNSIPFEHENFGVYKVMEDTVEGDCEVLYDITPFPKYVLQRTPYLAPQPQLAGQGKFIDIMKTKNFSYCEQRPGYHFGLTGSTDWEPTTNKMGNFLSRSSVSRIVVSGSLKSYTIQSSVTTNKVILSPEIYNIKKGEVVSRVNLTLLSVFSPSEEFETPKDVQILKKLVYGYNSPWTTDDVPSRPKWGQKINITEESVNSIRDRRSIENETNKTTKTHGVEIVSMKGIEDTEEWHQETPTMTEAPESPFLPYFVGYTGHSIHHSKDVNVKQVLKNIAKEIGEQLQYQSQVPKENTLSRFSILTKLIRTMNVGQLEEITQDMYVPKTTTGEVSEARRNAWMAYRDAVAQAGTGPALMTIVDFIKTKKIKGEEAAQVVSAIADSARYPTTEYMNTFFELIKSPEVMWEPGLNTSAIYTFSNLVRMAQVNMKTAHNRYPVHAFGYLIPKHETTVADVYIPYFAQQLEQAVKEGNSPKIQTYIRALGNFAHPKIIQVFEPYLNGKEPITDFQRTLMVASLNKLAIVYPRLARSILYKIYANTGEVYQVRVAAVYNLMKTDPPASMLQRMAQFTHEDPSNQVRSAVKSAITSASVSTDENTADLRKNAEAAVHLLTPQTFGVQYSQHNLTDYIVRGLNLVYMQSLSNIGSEDSLIPQTVFYHLNRNLNGLKQEAFTVGGMVSSYKDLEDLLDEKFKYAQYMGSGKKVPTETEKSLTIETISNILNLETGITKQLEGNILIGLTGFHRFIAFDNGTIESLPKMIKEMIQELENGKNLNYQKLYNEYSITIGLPTATGLPLVYTLKAPTLLSAKGKIGIQVMAPEQKYDQVYFIPDAINATAEMVLEYSTRTQCKISFTTPFDHTRYIAGYDKNLQVEVPVNTKLDVDLKYRHVKLQITPPNADKDTKLLHCSTWPFVAMDNILNFKPVSESKSIYRIMSRQPQKYRHQIGDKNFGVVFRVEGESDRDYTGIQQFYEKYQKDGFVSAILSTAVSDTIEQTSLNVYYDTELSTARSIVLFSSYDYCPVETEEDEVEEIPYDENRAITSIKEFDSEARRQQFIRRARKGLRSSTAHAIDAGMRIEGQYVSEYITTVAFAGSPLDGRARLLSFLRKLVHDERFEVCLDATSRIPKIPITNFLKILSSEVKGDIHGKVNFGEDCEEGSEVTVDGDFKRTEERKEYVENHTLAEHAKNETLNGYKLQPSQELIAKEAGVMDDYRFTIKYKNISENVEKMSYAFYDVLRYWGYPYFTENPFPQDQIREGQVQLGFNFTPDMKTVTAYIYSPLGDSRFNNLPVNKYVLKGLPFHPMYSTLERIASVALEKEYEGICTLDRNQIRTFNNHSYKAYLEKIWHVMIFSDLKGTYETPFEPGDNEPSDYLFVLSKNTAKNQKGVKIVVKGLEYSVIEIIPTPEEKILANVIINSVLIPLSEQHVYQYMSNENETIFQVYAMPSGEIKINSPIYKFQIMYCGESVRFILDKEYMNNVRGLCGTYNGDNFDFFTPQDYLLNNPDEFSSTWALSSEGEIGEMKNRAEEHSLYKKSAELIPVVSKQDVLRALSQTRAKIHVEPYTRNTNYQAFPEDNIKDWNELKKNSSPGCATLRIKVVEKDGKHCFSLYPQPACTSQCQAEKSQMKTGQFFCVEKSSTSTHWEQMVVRGANPDFRNRGETEEVTFEHPTKCVQA